MNNRTLSLDINGTSIFCQIKGSGIPILMIHGAVCDSDFFRRHIGDSCKESSCDHL